MRSTLTKNQRILETRIYKEGGNEYKIVLCIRYDDECGNGHNTFAMTARIYGKTSYGRWDDHSGGCCHEEIARRFPEYAHLIKWHLVSSDGPLHYFANTMYHAGDKDCHGLRKGEARSFDTFVKFGDFPIVFKYSKKFINFIIANRMHLKIEKLEHKKEESSGYKYAPKYTFSGLHDNPEWYQGEFDTRTAAVEFAQACKKYVPILVEYPTSWSEGKAPDLEAARSCAIWPDASLEQLTDKKALEAHLREIMPLFKADLEEIGLIY